MRPARTAVFGTLCACVALSFAPGCTGVLGLKVGILTDGGLGEPCYVQDNGTQTQCASAFACVGDVCRTACHADGDCAPTERCVSQDNQNGGMSLYGCVPIGGLPCSGGCGQAQVCDPSGQCRTSCNGGGGFGGSGSGFGGFGSSSGSFGGSSSGGGGGGSPGCASDQTCVSMNGPSACYGPHDGMTAPDGSTGDDAGDATITFDGTTGSMCTGATTYTDCSSCGQATACMQCLGCKGSGGFCGGSSNYGNCANCGMAGCNCPGCAQAPGPGSCQGSPTLCTTLGPAQCSSTPGCSPGGGFGGCTGMPYPCSTNATATSCNGVNGCSWVSQTPYQCTGSLTPCNALGASSCMSQPGCFWSGPPGPSCTGVLTPCNQLSSTECPLQRGCSLPGSTPDASGDDALGDAGCATGPTADGSMVCNCLSNDASVVTSQVVPGTPPAQSGGIVVDGTYFLVSAVIYYAGTGGPVTGPTFQVTLQISGSMVEGIESTSGGAPQTATSSLATSGTIFTLSDVCPVPQIRRGTFTATTTSLTLESALPTEAGRGTLVETFSKQ